MATFLAENWLVITFYLVVIGGLFLFRKKFEFQGKIVALLRTNWGVAWMQKYGEKHAKLIRGLGYVGIAVGFIGQLVIVGFLVWGLYQLLFNPAAPPVISPVLPGVQVPGSPIAFPLFETLIALFIVIVVHEASHGLVAAAHGIKVESSGLLMLGPIFGAFVEPDEKKLPKMPHKVQHSVYAAGPFSNVLLAILFLMLWFGFIIAVSSMVTPLGVSYATTVEGGPAELAGLPEAATITGVDSVTVTGSNDLLSELQAHSPGDTITILTEDGGSYEVALGANPEDAERAWLGIEGVETSFVGSDTHPWVFSLVSFIAGVLYWVFVLSLGLGLANLMPLGPVDGGRMWQLVLHKWLGKKRGDTVWAKSSFVVLMIVLILLFVPILRAVLPAIVALISGTPAA